MGNLLKFNSIFFSSKDLDQLSYTGLVYGLWCLVPLSPIFQEYQGCQFY